MFWPLRATDELRWKGQCRAEHQLCRGDSTELLCCSQRCSCHCVPASLARRAEIRTSTVFFTFRMCMWRAVASAIFCAVKVKTYWSSIYLRFMLQFCAALKNLRISLAKSLLPIGLLLWKLSGRVAADNFLEWSQILNIKYENPFLVLSTNRVAVNYWWDVFYYFWIFINKTPILIYCM